ncbi:peptidoglycan DD-metalloendopeptidase family protein [Aureivirga sp. CE67]|uniref:peptidoglycan DD-metalloendopeptidase family protein n=1 Tax=Aureivirga sp. CE67 TaxID=1788983 RepID=UPI0018CA9EE2|nr:peptidoglycan DD-metalloendopeptidase family protein [Aureivirga sp. CE67]
MSLKKFLNIVLLTTLISIGFKAEAQQLIYSTKFKNYNAEQKKFNKALEEARLELERIEAEKKAREAAIKAKKMAFLNENWSNKKFFAYDRKTIKEPFHLEFDTLNYTSPIDKDKVITSRFGWRKGRAHNGIDIDLIKGDSIRAILPGKVRYVKWHGGHGRTVVVRHENGLETVYAHMTKQLVKENQIVKQGDVLGTGGVTGNARGSHLHLEVRYKGQPINPEYLFDFSDKNEIRAKDLWVSRKYTNAVNFSSRRKPKIAVHSTKEEAEKSSKVQKKIYRIRSGDTLSKIAYRNNMSITQICKLNKISRNKTLRIGQKLILIE